MPFNPDSASTTPLYVQGFNAFRTPPPPTPPRAARRLIYLSSLPLALFGTDNRRTTTKNTSRDEEDREKDVHN